MHRIPFEIFTESCIAHDGLLASFLGKKVSTILGLFNPSRPHPRDEWRKLLVQALPQKNDNSRNAIKTKTVLAKQPTCALTRVSLMASTRVKARNNRKLSGPVSRHDLVPFYSAIDRQCKCAGRSVPVGRNGNAIFKFEWSTWRNCNGGCYSFL